MKSEELVPFLLNLSFILTFLVSTTFLVLALILKIQYFKQKETGKSANSLNLNARSAKYFKRGVMFLLIVLVGFLVVVFLGSTAGPRLDSEPLPLLN